MMPLMSFVLLTLAQVDVQVLGEFTRDGLRWKAVGVGAGHFTFSRAEEYSRKELRSARELNFMLLTMFGAGSGAPLPKPDHETYEHWRRLRESVLPASFEIAETVAFGGGAVMRVRSASGGLRRTVLAGRDPLLVTLDGKLFEIVYLALAGHGDHVMRRVDIYVRSSGPAGADDGLALLAKLRQHFPGIEVSLMIRQDCWFALDSTYPYVNPFVDEPLSAPPERTLTKPTLSCGTWTGSPTCLIR